MERYGEVLIIAMPFFMGLILLEKLYGHFKGEDFTPSMDMISGISSGVTNGVKDILGLSISILSYKWMVEHLALSEIRSTVLVYAIAFVVLDFQGYWVHRWAHKINFFWNKHAIHHSSEEFNLAVALRQSISSYINLFTFFLLPAALLGIPVVVIATVAPLHLFAQFWYHTRHIGRMGFLEHILVTPSHHRVHHAINKEYLDKNYAQIFIIWDKLFGTFQEERSDVPPVYGITRPAATWNPVRINFQHLWLLVKDAWHARDWRDKFRIWWMPTGWRPADVAARFPVPKIDDVYRFEKYNPPVSNRLVFWSYVQMAVTLLFTAHFFGNIGHIGSPGIFYYGLFIFLTVFSYSELMDMKRAAVFWEAVRVAAGLLLIYAQGDWFGAAALIPGIVWIIPAYLALSFGASVAFVRLEFYRRPIVSSPPAG
ncbi:MAG: sterol desaturase family protein [Saprospiraceae bacterium]|nr:sterol desaturase family protein [Saprospiraceae bacterium]